MPKVEIDYSNTIIYKITCKDPNVKDLYVGHTTNFVQRKHTHKQTCNDIKNTTPCKLYQVIRDNGGWNNWKMEIVNFFECKDHYEARKKEQEYFVLLNATLNSIEPMPKPKVTIPVEKVKVQKQIYHCEICNIKFKNLKLLDIHKNTKKHVKKQQVTEETNNSVNIPKVPKMVCSVCDYITDNKKDYNKHILTLKHLKNIKSSEKNEIIMNEVTDGDTLSLKSNKHICISCNKIYNSRNGLWLHKKKCITESIGNSEENIIIPEEKQQKTEEELRELKTMFIKMIEINQDLQKQIVELAKESKSIINSNNTTNNNTTNNKFNLQIFLNEKCKDAFNITDFINGINVGFKDFENFGKIGYVGSINNILIRELKEIDVYKRPIHCSDLKREVIHVKYNDAWVKDEDKKHMKRAIKLIEHKNIKLVPDWLKANPKADDITTKKHEEYMKILNNSMGEMKDEDNERNYDKIIRNVAKEILIDKDQK
jgi:hypothetical protein